MKFLVLGLYSVTPIHPGSGSEISVIDLPIQRERHTGFPVVWGQSLKGALRSAFPGEDNDPVKISIFGPPTDRAHEHSGAISVGDAKVLLFPVRSVKGLFAYVTSPFVLKRFAEDLERAGLIEKSQIDLRVEDGKAIVLEKDHFNVIHGSEKVILEDVSLNVEEKQIPKAVLDNIKKLIPRSDLTKRLVIVSDDLFTMFVKTGTEIVTRIRINPNTGTVDEGALWYEEFLPADTLLYSIILVNDPRKKIDNGKNALNASKLAENLKSKLSGFIQLGGDETVGKGFVKISWVTGDEH
ncbi:type III-B CRISPR module RAMP protein Cmr4 [Thermococcus sp. MAR1]|uniref:type III-B CRISPR module RAMP protein Cmr4 n=1 Tax=Thermococcus sp. MAR1 TaxID=1638263 RepID=UPI0014393E4A|nr:type III-B CRISPR module RAMP protein Cmr4 [Thermococcus sp. MAR1]NJE10067.1 type III-B CRISPR module RAMP protein Cmr4 [Thermococcus sp. MAR1]